MWRLFYIFECMTSLNERYSLHEIENFELLAKQVVEGFIIGLHQSPYHGFSAEFAEHKLYNPGESTKNIDWKVFARTDRLFNKRYDDETNLRCQIVLDISSSMTLVNRKQGLQKVSKIQWSSLAAASILYLLKKQRDAFGLSLFDDTIRLHTRNAGSLKQMRLLMSYLDEIYHHPPEGKKTTNVAGALHEISERIKKRSLVVIFSDFFDKSDNLEAMFSALQHLKHNKHEVIVFNVIDQQKEVEFDYRNKPMKFIDYESGEVLKVRPHELKDLYKKKMDEYLDHLKLKCLQIGVDFQFADINKDFNAVLRSFLIRRNKTV